MRHSDNTRKQAAWHRLGAALFVLTLGACQSGSSGDGAPVYDLVHGCYALVRADGAALRTVDENVRFASTGGAASVFRLQPSDLGHYLLYDHEAHYLTASTAETGREGVYRVIRTADKQRLGIPHHQQYSDAEWAIVAPGDAGDPYVLRHLNSGKTLGRDGTLGGKAAKVRFVVADGCLDYPELSLDAAGSLRAAPWPDGHVYGVADVHEHMFTNVGFGGGGIFHGAPYHRLGVEHALEDCDGVHGTDGRRDIMGSFWTSGRDAFAVEDVAQILAEGRVADFSHETNGYPEFTSWPNPRDAPTHQQQYYRWLERAYMGGLRLLVQLATGNSALCELMVGLGAQTAPYTCNDMVSVDRMLTEVRGLERYIDARAGGPGRGWFRIVETPQAAREVINQGKLAVVLGIEISNIFDCFLTPPPGFPPCDMAQIRAAVAEYYDAGIRVVFPVHKYDNGFSPGDGHRGVIELGNVINSGHYSNFTLDCPDLTNNFDSGDVVFGGLNEPREEYVSRPPLDVSLLKERTVETLLPLLPGLAGRSLNGDYCQAAGLTSLGRVLFEELMARGMVIDLAHLPRWSTVDALEILDQHRYPAISTHGQSYEGQIYQYGGFRNAGFAGCADPTTSGTLAQPYLERAQEVQDANGLPGQPLGFDLNGFAGSRGPRFGPDSGCPQPQSNPVEYPFESYSGMVTFTQPMLGNRTVDFNAEGMLHIGMLPELIEDVRRDGTSDAELEPLFRTAETFLQMWEGTEAAKLRME